jgi:hypothetical protein
MKKADLLPILACNRSNRMRELSMLLLLPSMLAAQSRVAVHAGRLLDVRSRNYRTDVHIVIQGYREHPRRNLL